MRLDLCRPDNDPRKENLPIKSNQMENEEEEKANKMKGEEEEKKAEN